MEDKKKFELDDDNLDAVSGGYDEEDRICPKCGERVVPMAPPPLWYTDPVPQYTCIFCDYVEW